MFDSSCFLVKAQTDSPRLLSFITLLPASYNKGVVICVMLCTLILNWPNGRMRNIKKRKKKKIEKKTRQAGQEEILAFPR